MRTGSKRYLTQDLILLSFLALLVVVLTALTGGGRPATGFARAEPVSVRFRAPAGAPRMPPGFLGLSLEYGALQAYAGGVSPDGPDQLLVSLLHQISPGGGLVLRIGGVSADSAWWPAPGVSKPPVVRFTLDAAYARLLRAVTYRLRARLIIGLNLEADQPALAAAEAERFSSALPGGTISAFELGNEPDLYSTFAWYRVAGRIVTGRPPGYDFPQYLADFTRFSAAIPGVPLGGPSSNNSSWAARISSFLSTSSKIGMVTLHRYPLQLCFIARGSPRYPTIRNLLAPAAAAGFAAPFGPLARLAHQHGVPLRLDETNSVGCGSARTVSQSYASALWAPEVLFQLAARGVDGVNFHTFPGAGYELFSMHSGGGAREAAVSPEFYGLILFARAAPPGSRILIGTGRLPRSLHVWATIGRDGRERVLLINDDARRARAIVFAPVPGQRPEADVQLMQGPGLRATGGVTLGARTFGARTHTGILAAARTTTALRRHGRMTLQVPPGAALLAVFR